MGKNEVNNIKRGTNIKQGVCTGRKAVVKRKD
jgi:hypothetical protein